MRQSTARLAATTLRLADLEFPATRAQVHRTRLAYIHIDNLLHFAKADRDGRIDGYLAAYLPDEVAFFFMRRGEVVTAAAMTDHSREVIPIGVARERMLAELERGQLVFSEASEEQLHWMYASCAMPMTTRSVGAGDPTTLFRELQQERFTGVLELIVNGTVSYLRYLHGVYQNGFFCGKSESVTVSRFMERLFTPGKDGKAPVVSAATFAPAGEMQAQADPARIAKYRDLFWRIVDTAESEVEGEALKRAAKTRDSLTQAHPSLAAVGADRGQDPAPIVVTPEELTEALAEWSRALLSDLEIIAPGVAERVLKEATHEYRFVLLKAGFYSRLPWTIAW